jgi:hypothetical protein
LSPAGEMLVTEALYGLRTGYSHWQARLATSAGICHQAVVV